MNRKSLLTLIVVLLAFLDLQSQNILSLEDVILRAKTMSISFKQTETRRENRLWFYRANRTTFNPQIRLSDNGGSLYTNTYFPVRQQDGSIVYQQVNQYNPGANLGLFQPIQWTGGTVSVNTTYNYFRDNISNEKQWNGQPVNIRLNQPIFGFNSWKWDRMIEPIRFEESKRDYAEGMEQISHDAVDFFFGVMGEQVNLQIAQYNLANNDTIYKIEQGRYNIGTTSEDKLLQVELQLLRSRQDVAKASLDLRTAAQKLRSFIGLLSGDNLSLVLPETIPQMVVSEEEAMEHAKKTRSAYIAFERRKLEAKESVAQVRGQLYQVGISAQYGLNNVTPRFSDIYHNTTNQQLANVTFNIPIVDWGRRRAQMQTAYANKRLMDYTIEQDEITFEQDILTQVRQFEMLHLQIEISKKADEVALKRYNVAQNRYLIGKIDITNLNIALVEKDGAKRAYLQALRNFWLAYYDLRRLTLYDFLDRKYLYNPYGKD